MKKDEKSYMKERVVPKNIETRSSCAAFGGRAMPMDSENRTIPSRRGEVTLATSRREEEILENLDAPTVFNIANQCRVMLGLNALRTYLV